MGVEWSQAKLNVCKKKEDVENVLVMINQEYES